MPCSTNFLVTLDFFYLQLFSSHLIPCFLCMMQQLCTFVLSDLIPGYFFFVVLIQIVMKLSSCLVSPSIPVLYHIPHSIAAHRPHHTHTTDPKSLLLNVSNLFSFFDVPILMTIVSKKLYFQCLLSLHIKMKILLQVV